MIKLQIWTLLRRRATDGQVKFIMNKTYNDKTYNHKAYESKIYDLWEKSGAFTPKLDKKKKPYTIVLPLPNASGKMHTGNVLMIAIEDLLIRWKRMQ